MNGMSFLFVSGWGHGSSALAPATAHGATPVLQRSTTPTPTTPAKSRLDFSLPHKLIKSNSTSNIVQTRNMAVASPQHPVSAMRDDAVMDTRTPSPVQRGDSTDGGSGKDYKPDLSAEVAMLSTKLVNAINFQTNLDDSLQETRHELEHERQENARLRAIEEMVGSGVLVKRQELDQTIAQLRAELATERTARESAEKAKKETEGELETLTTALFEEANTMVAAARRDNETVERRNIQLRSQLNDTELLLASQQEQLRDLKETMERIRDASPSRRGDGSVPSTPITTNTAIFDAMLSSPEMSAPADLIPEHPLHFSHLITPLLRSDTAAYVEFQELLVQARRLGAHSRQSSNSTNANPALTSQPNLSTPASTSSPSLPGAFSFGANSSPSTSTFTNLPPLKDSKFYRRSLTEDLDPTLRLDLAPALSFLSRRAVQAALLSGSLSIERYPQNRDYSACALCGESRRSAQHIRRHRFRTSEEDAAPKRLCDFCLGRVRASCNFVGFLRLVRNGLWRCETPAEQEAAWEEAVRLRERMFWARVGGGVVPSAALQHQRHVEAMEGAAPATPGSNSAVKSARVSLESVAERKMSAFAQSGAQEEGLVADLGMMKLEPAPKERRPSLGVDRAMLGTILGPPVAVPTELDAPAPPIETPAPGPAPATPMAADTEPDTAAAASPPTRPFEDAVADPLTASAPVPAPEHSSTRQGEASRLSADHLRPQPAERKNSGVLARVRAMEAQSSGSRGVPGAFE